MPVLGRASYRAQSINIRSELDAFSQGPRDTFAHGSWNVMGKHLASCNVSSMVTNCWATIRNNRWINHEKLMIPQACKNSGRFIINPGTSTQLEIRTVTMTVTSICWVLTLSQTRFYILYVQRQLIAFLQQLREVDVIVQCISASILLTGMSHMAQTAKWPVPGWNSGHY